MQDSNFSAAEENLSDSKLESTNDATVNENTSKPQVGGDADLDPQKSTEKALELKLQGNELYKKGDYKGVIDSEICYHQAITIYREALSYTPLDDNKTAGILYSNCATCYYNQEDYQMAIECATEAINIDKTYVKPLICRGNSLYELQKFEEAHEDYTEAEKLDPTITKDSSLRYKMADARKKHDASMEKKKAEVLSGLKDIGNTILGKFGLSIDNFKMQQNENGSYNINFQK